MTQKPYAINLTKFLKMQQTAYSLVYDLTRDIFEKDILCG
jgi:hypothetical protein